MTKRGMNYLVKKVNAGPNDLIKVILDKQANVRVMDSQNYQNYRKGRIHRYSGGHVKKSPFHIRPPRRGHWYVVIDLGGYPGRVRASVILVRG